jgi:hypothetical protein
MSAVAELNWLDRENADIQAAAPAADAAEATWAAWWFRLANWWHRRDLSFGDGSGMKLECSARASKLIAGKECEFCGDPATTVEAFDLAVFVCDRCGVQEFNR